MKALLLAIDININTLTRVAFHRDYDKPQWTKARMSWRQFLYGILLQDIQQTSAVITETCRLMGHAALKKPLGKIPRLSACASLWPKVYQSIYRDDPDGLSNILQLVSEASHIDIIAKNAFTPILSLTDIGEAYANGSSVITAINNTLSLIHTGFLDVIKNVVDYSTSSQLSGVLQRPRVGKAAMLLLLSPVDDFHTTARTLIGQVFDVDGRPDCIRAMLEKLPDPAFGGLLEFLNKFCTYAPSVPEACSLSKSLVRCFTDVIDALCSKPDGLLRNSRFLRRDGSYGPDSRLIDLWTLMSKALAVIFRRTPAWSIYFDSAEMIEWMRDALIFGRDMLAQWQVLESAAVAFHQYLKKEGKSQENASVNSSSEIGPKMISCFQDVLTELTRWLRLTDEELLHQSFSLLQSLLELFRKQGIRPCEAALTKLTRYVESARNDVNQTRSRLDTSRITSLEELLSTFNDEDDGEIQIISVKVGSTTSVVAKQEGEITDKASKEREYKDARLSVPDRGKAKPAISSYLTDKDRNKFDRSVPPTPALEKQIEHIPAPLENQRILYQKNRFKNEATSSAHLDHESESEESESDSEAPGGLASLAKKFARSPKIRKPVERRQIKTLELSVKENPAIARMKQREEVHKARMRMKPDISGLHRVLLSWNYDHNGPTPPGFDAQVSQVPDTFTNFADFHRVFEPLLILECWAQILQAKDEKPEIYECQLSGKSYVDDWLELDITFKTNLRKGFYLAETDVVLLRQPQTSKCIFAKTRSFSSNFQATHASLRCYIRNGVEDPGLHISTFWKISKVFRYAPSHTACNSRPAHHQSILA
jgi:senataxin